MKTEEENKKSKIPDINLHNPVLAKAFRSFCIENGHEVKKPDASEQKRIEEVAENIKNGKTLQYFNGCDDSLSYRDFGSYFVE